ncbi:MAG: NAD(P)H-hydrate dehydratase [Kiritimatiellae bacterium]|nr:NAD(P)H-hydrate dehydratase [Kiritimatiellia bacterium]
MIRGVFDPPETLAGAFPPRDARMHKYSAGSVAVVGGSDAFPNAPALAALGARSAGAGMVRIASVDGTRAAAACLVPEATFVPGFPDVAPRLPRVDAAAVGMGLGSSAERIVRSVLSCGSVNAVLDADALSAIADAERSGRPILPAPGCTAVLTPHSAEAAKLLGCTSAEIDAGRDAAAEEIRRRFRATVVLKGPGTIVLSEDGKWKFVSDRGNPFMALGGMGDLLSGAIAARWARLVRSGMSAAAAAPLAAAAAVWLHSAAADSLVCADSPVEPSAANTAARMASMRIALERIVS